MSAKTRWFSWIPQVFERVYYGLLSPFVSNGFIKQTKIYEETEWRAQRMNSALNELMRKNEDIEDEKNGLLEDVSSLESQLDYYESEISETTGKLCEILGNYQKLTEKHNVKGNIELPPLEELKGDYEGRMKAIDLLARLHEAKNNIILHLKKENSKKDRQLLDLNERFESYKSDIAKQLAKMEPKERLVAVFENADDSFFILNNNFQVEYLSNATKDILGCEKQEELGYYLDEHFKQWFSEKMQYSKFENLVNQAAIENRRSFGNFEFEINSRKKTTIPLIADIEVIRIGYDEQTFKGYLVLIDKAKFTARIKAYAAKQLEKLTSPAPKYDAKGELAPENSS